MIRQRDLLSQVFSSPSYLLIVLDACRADAFEYLGFDSLGSYRRVWSCGSHTLDFLERCIPSEGIDAVYVSANPHVNARNLFYPSTQRFARVVEVWRWGWREDLGTVHPATVASVASALLAKGVRKMVVHFIQPHAPYIGRFRLLRGNLFQTKAFVERGETPPPDPVTDVDPRTLWRAYLSNLDLVMRYAYTLAQRARLRYGIDRVVITSDHGEIISEAPVSIDRHPRGLAWRCLREVPWLEL